MIGQLPHQKTICRKLCVHSCVCEMDEVDGQEALCSNLEEIMEWSVDVAMCL